MPDGSVTSKRDRALRIGITAWATIGVVIVLAGAGWLVGRLSAALTPFVMAGIIVLILRGPVNRLERRGVPRAASVGIAYLAGAVVLGVLGAFVVPAVGSQVTQFLNDFPTYYSAAQDFWSSLQHQFAGVVIPGWAQAGVSQLGSSITEQFASWSQSLAAGILSAGGAAATFAFNVVFSLVIAFWALRDLPAMHDEIVDLTGAERRAETEMIIATVLRVLGGYFKGQAIVSLVTGTLAWIGLALLGVPYSFVLGLITGVLNVIPYVGAFLGGLISAIVAAFVGPWIAVGSIAVTIAAQQLTDLFVTPRVMSEQVDLHPLLVIFSLLAGGTLFGFVGLLFAIPVAAIGKGLFVYYYEKHTQRPLGTEQGALFRKKRQAEQGEPPSEGSEEPPADEESAEERD